MQMWRANSNQVNPWTYPLRGVFTRTIGCSKPLELSHTVVITRGLFIPTTYFQQTHEQSPECYNDIIAQSPGICTLISDESSKELIKQAPRLLTLMHPVVLEFREVQRVLNYQSFRHLLWIFSSLCVSMHTHTNVYIWNKYEALDLVSFLSVTYFSITGSLVQADLSQFFSRNSKMPTSPIYSSATKSLLKQKWQSIDHLEWSRSCSQHPVPHPSDITERHAQPRLASFPSFSLHTLNIYLFAMSCFWGFVDMYELFHENS